jgi:hypothetical protein
MLAEHSINQRSREAQSLESARRRLIAQVALGSQQLCVCGGDSLGLVIGRRTDRASRGLAIDSALDQFGNEARVTDRLAWTLDIERREQRIVEISITLTVGDGCGDFIEFEALCLELLPKLRFGEPSQRQKPQCGKPCVRSHLRFSRRTRSVDLVGADCRTNGLGGAIGGDRRFERFSNLRLDLERKIHMFFEKGFRVFTALTDTGLAVRPP